MSEVPRRGHQQVQNTKQVVAHILKIVYKISMDLKCNSEV
jgi:hypothetical protein